MLHQTDIDRVKSYMFEGFPNLQDKVAFRRFDPPRLSFYSEEDRDKVIDAWELKIKHDFLSQFNGKAREEAEWALRSTLSGGGMLTGPAVRHDFLKQSLYHEPARVALRTTIDKAEISLGYYYITQYSSTLGNQGHYREWMMNDHPDKPVPANMERISNIFAAAHEITHAVQNEHSDTVTNEDECVCDGVATACVLALEGNAALPALNIIRDGRICSVDELHNTGMILFQLLGKSMLSGGIGAKQAQEITKNLYGRMNPAVPVLDQISRPFIP